ncbi:rubredoxin [Synechococcales cyanobacterium C]|uniref:Rubredoxin n=1 Tax=Petrachloros mirabilis ULC683 TaxID=2781853 RepID=A0A8K2A7A4_9CYAN|nr:rubredoxin [Petrachloros mirabilis]NCJ05860.1 rubredoxin [Petrachloros mirabilis ULC683]
MSTETADSSSIDRYECRACGYVYEPEKGDSRHQVPQGTAFAELPSEWVCPVCGASKQKFSNIGPTGTPSGFKENLGYGFGVNTLAPGQKNLLIFSVLGLLILLLLSFYGLG